LAKAVPPVYLELKKSCQRLTAFRCVKSFAPWVGSGLFFLKKTTAFYLAGVYWKHSQLIGYRQPYYRW